MLLVAGRVYKFRYRARNVFGWSAWSQVGDIIAASVPDRMPAVITSLQGVYVKIDWASGTPFNGQPITQFEIKIRTSNSSLYVHESTCDGGEQHTFN